jgi:dihydroflavonol-4-reductase
MASQILITGSTGFIGRHLAWDLTSQGHTVRVLARHSKKAHSLFSDTVEIQTGDVRDADSVKKACTGIDTIYHIAGIFRFGIRRHREIYATNVEGTENLLRAASSTNVTKVVHVSSASVLGRDKKASNQKAILDENDFPSRPPQFSPYKFSKWEAEKRALSWAKQGLPVVIANISCPIGHGDEAPTPTGRIIDDFIRGRFPCYCHVGLNFVNVSDVSTGLQKLAHAGRAGERYLLTNQNMWLKELLDCLANQTGMPTPRVCLPHWSIEAMSYFAEMFDFLNPRSKSARLCIETALESRNAQFFSNAKARQELGWSPSSIQIGIQQALAWFQGDSAAESIYASLPATKSHAR